MVVGIIERTDVPEAAQFAMPGSNAAVSAPESVKEEEIQVQLAELIVPKQLSGNRLCCSGISANQSMPSAEWQSDAGLLLCGWLSKSWSLFESLV